MEDASEVAEKWEAANEAKARELFQDLVEFIRNNPKYERHTSEANYTLGRMGICFKDGTLIEVSVGEYEPDSDDDFLYEAEEYITSLPQWSAMAADEPQPTGLLGALIDLGENGPPKGGRDEY